MKNICFFVTSLEPGGIETYLLRFLQYSMGKFNAVIVCKSGKTGALLPDYQKTGATIIPLKVGYVDPTKWVRISGIFKQYNIDTVCDFTGNFAGLTLMLAAKAGIQKRIAFYRHSSNHFKNTGFRSFYNKKVLQLVDKHATRILSNSASALSFFFADRKTDPRFEVIRNGISETFYKADLSKQDARLKFGLSQDAYIVGHTGRYNEAKNHKTIITVGKQLIDTIPNVHFVFAGRHTDNDEVKKLVKDAGLQQHFTLLGYQKEINQLLRAFDLFYFPSLTEGQPNSLLEALMVGVPVVASNIEPIVESLPATIHNQLVPAKDIEAAKDAIVQMYQNPDATKVAEVQQWAIKNYDAEERFQQFLVNLI